MSRSRLWIIAVLAVLLPAGVLAGGDADELFRTLDESMGVVWVSVDLATAEDGSMDWEAVSKTFRDFYDSYRDDVPFPLLGYTDDGKPIADPRQPRWIEGFGAYWGESYMFRGVQPPARTTDELIAHSKYIVEGTITDLEPGFWESEPATLLTVEVSRMVVPETIEDPVLHTPSSRTVYVAYPLARFTIGGHGFEKGDPAYPALPSVGDSMLFFEPFMAYTTRRVVFRPMADKILFASPGGAVEGDHYRQTWTQDNDRSVPDSFSELAERVARSRSFQVIDTGSGSDS